MTTQVKKTNVTTNPEYDIVLKRLHLYYDMKLVTFHINEYSDLIIKFPVFVQPYNQFLLTLYQMEIVCPYNRSEYNS